MVEQEYLKSGKHATKKLFMNMLVSGLVWQLSKTFNLKYHFTPLMREFMSILVFNNRNADFDEEPHYDIDAKNSKCPGSLEVCCRHPDGLPYTPKAPPPPQEPEGPNDVDIDGPVEKNHCGRRNKNGLGVSIR